MEQKGQISNAIAEFEAKLAADPPATVELMRAAGRAYHKLAEIVRTSKIEMSAIVCAAEAEIESLGERAREEGTEESALKAQIIERGRREVRESAKRAADAVRRLLPLLAEET